MKTNNVIGSALLCLLGIYACAQINPAHITIVRDSFGVPHIYGKTDAEAAYGLAYAHCEDDFLNIQYNLLAAKGMLARAIGKEGLLFDFAIKFFGIDTLVENRYELAISPDFRKVLEGYIQGVNDYAARHPEEVVLREALPFSALELIKGSTLTLTLFAGGGMALQAIRENVIELVHQPNETGSNALAVAPSKTDDGKAWLLVNSHQPIEGRYAWYEAHIRSDEGWDVIGGLFPGGATIFLGTNRHLGWAHTTNYHTFGDIYKLRRKGRRYLYDGEWKNFTVKKVKLHVKIAGIIVGITRKIFYSVHGPVFKNKRAWYALRFPGAMDIRSMEQWYRMNKARSFQEFEQALRMEALPLFNIVYADVEGNIFYQSGCQVPLRDTTLNWNQPVDGTSPAYLWNKLVPYQQKPALYNPACGYLYSCNQTQYFVSGKGCEWKGYWPGIQLFNYNRGEVFGEQLAAISGKISWQDVLRIKFDKSYAKNGSYARNFSALFRLDEKKYPDIADVIRKLKQWNLRGDVNNREAPVAMILHEHLRKAWKVPFAFLMIKRQPLTESDLVPHLRATKRFMLDKYGTTDVALGDIQRMIRGNKSYPASGLREVPRAADPKLYDKTHGIWRITGGDGYMQLNKYSAAGVEVFSVSPYGASNRPESPHYNDQMELFAQEKFKRMTFDWNEILKKAERVYNPVQ
ncbi:MAG: penicillin acylase family protein [Chitinophagales bacterium]|nr:penicillin acylase family protein [Chitinophagales bacterium]MDW8417945.1 penicillin acylase family protein [Chitinophagales bacterium]